MNGFIGERNETDRIRYADNAGLVLGYLNYSPTDRVFGCDHSTLIYTEQGSLDTMPKVAGWDCSTEVSTEYMLETEKLFTVLKVLVMSQKSLFQMAAGQVGVPMME